MKKDIFNVSDLIAQYYTCPTLILKNGIQQFSHFPLVFYSIHFCISQDVDTLIIYVSVIKQINKNTLNSSFKPGEGPVIEACCGEYKIAVRGFE